MSHQEKTGESVASLSCFRCGIDLPDSEIKKVVVGICSEEGEPSRWLVQMKCPPCADRTYHEWAGGRYMG